MELAQDRVQWWALVLAVLNRCVLLPESQLIGKMDLIEIGCEDERWMELAQDRVQWEDLILADLKEKRVGKIESGFQQLMVVFGRVLGYQRYSAT